MTQILALFDVKHHYFRQIVDGIVLALHNSNKNLNITYMAYDEALLVAADLPWLAVIADFDMDRHVELCLQLDAPVIAVKSHLQQPVDQRFRKITYLTPNTELICQTAANHLLACGVKQMGFFAGMADEIGLWPEERRQHFEVLAKNSDAQWIGSFTTFNIRQFLEQGITDKTGFLCACDTQARQLITLADVLSIDVPGLISVIGIDNDETENHTSLVPITSIPLDPIEIGKSAFEALLSLLASCDEEKRNVQKYEPGAIVNRLSAFLDVSDDPMVTKAMTYIHRNYHRPIRAEQVYSECDTSRNSLEFRFKKLLNRTVHQVIHDVRIENAKDLLVNSNTSIEEISKQCGLSSPQYLYYLFRHEVGMTPTKYRQIKTETT